MTLAPALVTLAQPHHVRTTAALQPQRRRTRPSFPDADPDTVERGTASHNSPLRSLPGQL
jgi:hypothetical protein